MSLQVDVADVDSLLHITLRFAEDNPYLETTEITRLVAPYDASTLAQVSPVAWKPGQVRILGLCQNQYFQFMIRCKIFHGHVFVCF